MILLDTDVLIDTALDRSPHSQPAADLLDRIEYGAESAFIAWHSISNFYYIVAPVSGGASARDFIVELTGFVSVATTDTEAVRYAAGLPMSDFEGRHAGGCRPCLRRPAHRNRKRQRLPTLSNPRGRTTGSDPPAVLTD